MKPRLITTRRYRRGAAMVEAVIVVSVFILFFLGLSFFRRMNEQKFKVAQLSRTAAVAYALSGCPKGGDALAQIKPDLGSATDNQSGQSTGSSTGIGGGSSDPTLPGSNKGSSQSPVGSLMGNQGVAGDPIAGISLKAGAQAGTNDGTAFSGNKVFLHTTVHADSYMSCGEQRQDGDKNGNFSFSGGFQYAKELTGF